MRSFPVVNFALYFKNLHATCALQTPCQQLEYHDVPEISPWHFLQFSRNFKPPRILLCTNFEARIARLCSQYIIPVQSQSDRRGRASRYCPTLSHSCAVALQYRVCCRVQVQLLFALLCHLISVGIIQKITSDHPKLPLCTWPFLYPQFKYPSPSS